MLEKVHLNVNGQIHEVNIETDTPLIYVLRNDLGFKGAKLACGLGQCGACKVIIDGQALPICRVSAMSVQGKEITTIEGIGSAHDLHPLQKAFIEEQAVQCGFCASGMIMAAKGLLDKNPCPTDAEIQTEMSGNLCRCGTYGRVMRAIKRASPALIGIVTRFCAPATHPRSKRCF
jgi:nicotinate dehydrogenase subunit A